MLHKRMTNRIVQGIHYGHVHITIHLLSSLAKLQTI